MPDQPCACVIRDGHLVERCPEAERLWDEIEHNSGFDYLNDLVILNDADERQAYEDHLIAAALNSTRQRSTTLP